MSAIFSSVSTENIEFAKLLLNLAFLGATVGVWIGVWLEGKRFTEATQEIGWKVLVACLGIEATFGIALLQLDSEIGRRQKIEVANLTRLGEEARERAVNAELELAKIKTPRALTNKQKEDLNRELKPLAAELNGIIRILYVKETEPSIFAGELKLAFETAGIKIPPMDGEFAETKRFDKDIVLFLQSESQIGLANRLIMALDAAKIDLVSKIDPKFPGKLNLAILAKR